MAWSIIFSGFAVGILVGLTGFGGGALMTPRLILTDRVRPLTAVGTNLVWGAATKAAGAFVHFRQKTVDVTIAWYLGLGSLPAALLGAATLAWIRGLGSEAAVDLFVRRSIGFVLLCLALSLLVQLFIDDSSRRPRAYPHPIRNQKALTIITGALIGFLVGLTSVGSGSLILAC